MPDSQPTLPDVPRDDTGKWLPGVSGNPSGRPRDPVRSIARDRAPEALEVLLRIMVDEAAPVAQRITAANSVLDRGLGRPISMQAEVSPTGEERAVSSASLVALGRVLLEVERSRDPRIVSVQTLPPATYDPMLIETARRLAFVAHQAKKAASEAVAETRAEPTEEGPASD